MATTVTTSFKDCVITVTHKIFFENYNNGFTADQFAAKKKAIMAELQKKWMDPDFKWGCCKVKFVITEATKDGDDVDKKNLRNEKGRSKQSGLTPSEGGLGPKKTIGDWFVPEGPPKVENIPLSGHEVGHELGAEDGYLEDPILGTARKPGYPEGGIMYDESGTVQQTDIDQIMEGLERELQEKLKKEHGGQAKLNAGAGKLCPKYCCDDKKKSKIDIKLSKDDPPPEKTTEKKK